MFEKIKPCLLVEIPQTLKIGLPPLARQSRTAAMCRLLTGWSYNHMFSANASTRKKRIGTDFNTLCVRIVCHLLPSRKEFRILVVHVKSASKRQNYHFKSNLLSLINRPLYLSRIGAQQMMHYRIFGNPRCDDAVHSSQRETSTLTVSRVVDQLKSSATSKRVSRRNVLRWAVGRFDSQQAGHLFQIVDLGCVLRIVAPMHNMSIC